MKALESLISEHQLIARVVGALELFLERLQHHGPSALVDLGRFVEVFVELGDRIHHEKEENILLPLLSRHGFDWDSGVLPSVRREHRQERYLIDVLSQVSQSTMSWGEEAKRHIVASARALIEFQRAHHELENQKLFPLMAMRLGDEALAELQVALERFDADPGHRERAAAAKAVALELIAAYPPRVGAPASLGLPGDHEGMPIFMECGEPPGRAAPPRPE